jgi:hypothetical protein
MKTIAEAWQHFLNTKIPADMRDNHDLLEHAKIMFYTGFNYGQNVITNLANTEVKEKGSSLSLSQKLDRLHSEFEAYYEFWKGN